MRRLRRGDWVKVMPTNQQTLDVLCLEAQTAYKVLSCHPDSTCGSGFRVIVEGGSGYDMGWFVLDKESRFKELMQMYEVNKSR